MQMVLNSKSLIIVMFTISNLMRSNSFSVFDFLKSPATTIENEPPAASPYIRGVTELNKDKYIVEAGISCDNNEKFISPHQINDNFCDCKDGSDEPGTSACSNGRFQCLNVGYRVISIPSSRVDDGICDCCDGSDEGIIVTCRNTCKQYAEMEKAAMSKIYSSYQTGNQIRGKAIESTLKEKGASAMKLKSAQSEVNRIQKVIEEKTDTLNTISKVRDELKQVRKTKLLTKVQDLLNFQQFSLSELVQLLTQYIKIVEIRDGDIQRLITSMMNGTKNDQEPSHINETTTEQEEMETGNTEEGDVDEHYGDETPEVTDLSINSCEVPEFSADVRFKDLCRSSDPKQHVIELFINIIDEKNAFNEIMLLFGFYLTHHDIAITEELIRAHLSSETQSSCPIAFESISNICNLKDVLAHEFNTMNEISNEEFKVDEDIKSIEDEITLQNERLAKCTSERNSAKNAMDDLQKYNDFIEYLSLQGKCFDSVDGKFTYTVCIMQDVKQRENDGDHNTVTLGVFDGFETLENGNTVMHFKRGQYCHAFGERSADILVTCGVETTLLSASEPSTCYYQFQMTSPMACTPRHAIVNGIPSITN